MTPWMPLEASRAFGVFTVHSPILFSVSDAISYTHRRHRIPKANTETTSSAFTQYN